MHIAILADRSDIHTVRWVNALCGRGYDISLLTMHSSGESINSKVAVHCLPFSSPYGYYLNAPFLRHELNKINPDLLHVHYASGYGTLARLGGKHPLLLSVWGSDVYEFPYRTPLHHWIIKKNMDTADHICSTSYDMARQTQSLGEDNRSITVTPFGVDMKKFCPEGEKVNLFGEKNTGKIVVGTVKKLENKYGIDILIHAFARLRKRLAREDEHLANALRLLIVGDGPLRDELEEQAEKEDVRDITKFTGNVPHAKVPSYLRTLDVFVAASRSESFGVAVIEAAACQCPTVVSDAGGLPEVVEDGKTGIVVPREDVQATSAAIYKLVKDTEARRKMGQAGRAHVKSLYNWELCLDRMEEVYASLA